MRVGAERARLHDRIARLDVEIAHRCEDPRQTDRACFGRGDLATCVRRIEIVEVTERGGRRQLREPSDLLPRPALEIRAEQERPSRSVTERAGESGDSGAGAAKENEPAYPGGERLLD